MMDKAKLVKMQDDHDFEAQHSQEEHRIIKVPTSLCYSVFVTLCCCSPVGVVAMVMSMLSHESVSAGKHEKATHRARLSRKMSNIALGIGFIVWLCVALYVCLIIFVLPGAQNQQMMLHGALQNAAKAHAAQNQQMMPMPEQSP